MLIQIRKPFHLILKIDILPVVLFETVNKIWILMLPREGGIEVVEGRGGGGVSEEVPHRSELLCKLLNNKVTIYHL